LTEDFDILFDRLFQPLQRLRQYRPRAGDAFLRVAATAVMSVTCIIGLARVSMNTLWFQYA
jgi:hypothetical protein